jgi:hypothetical protein
LRLGDYSYVLSTNESVAIKLPLRALGQTIKKAGSQDFCSKKCAEYAAWKIIQTAEHRFNVHLWRPEQSWRRLKGDALDSYNSILHLKM